MIFIAKYTVMTKFFHRTFVNIKLFNEETTNLPSNSSACSGEEKPVV